MWASGNWHSAAFTWDGEVLVLGWEPGGGLQAECEATDPPIKKSFFFYDADDGSKLGQWTLPRPQGAQENCTLHNYNLVPLRNGRDMMVSGNYQAGVWVVDITDPNDPQTVGWSDPPAGPLRRGCRYAADLLHSRWGLPADRSMVGLLVQRVHLREPHRRGLEHLRAERQHASREAIMLPQLNPQTQEFSLPEERAPRDPEARAAAAALALSEGMRSERVGYVLPAWREEGIRVSPAAAGPCVDQTTHWEGVRCPPSAGAYTS